MTFAFAGFLLAAAAVPAVAGNAAMPSLIPIPKSLELREGAFRLTPGTRLVTDVAGRETGRYLAEVLHPSTGYRFPARASATPPPPPFIYLTRSGAATNLGPEGYQLTVTSNSVVIRAPSPAGLYYGVQTLLQLFPPQIFSRARVEQVDWRIPCIQIEDQPRFRWRGLMLDVGRHFFNQAEVERLLDLMAFHKLNVFHWHLTDREGWRLESRRYPRLTQLGAWRPDIGFGLDPRSSTAYAADGRYGGFYSQADIREIVAYAAARHITIVPEIEMPGHSTAALEAYPELNCATAAGAAAPQLGVYCAGKEQTFAFLEDVLQEVFELFPGRYIHIGGDEVSKENWKQCPQCQARMKREGLKDGHELQSYFIRRIEKFVRAHGRTLVGWSEIRQGGLAQNAVMMDWIGGGAESASQGHDVVMSSGDYCYFDHYQSLDYSREPVAIACYLPLRGVYEFEPIPAALAPQFQGHILGGQANVWTEYIASPRYLDYMTFPRLCALAEVVWSPRTACQWEDFSRRLETHRRRLDYLGVTYRSEQATKIGEWAPAQLSSPSTTLEWDVTRLLSQPNPRQVIIDDKTRELTPDFITEPGKCHVVFEHTHGGTLKIQSVALLEDRHEISIDTHAGIAGPEPRDLVARDVVYVLSLSRGRKGARYSIRAQVTAEGNRDTSGVVTLEPSVRGNLP